MAARREDRLKSVGAEIRRDFSVDYRAVKTDLSDPSFFGLIEAATRDIDVGTIVGNAGFASPGAFLSLDREELLRVEAYVLNFGEGLHIELAPRGVHVTVLLPGPTWKESMAKMGVDPAEMPLKPMTAERCASEAIHALSRNRATHIAGRVNRVMARLLPRAVATRMMGQMIGKTFACAALSSGERPLPKSARQP